MHKLYVSFFIICVALGSKAEDIFKMLIGANDTPLTLTDGTVKVDVDSSFFAKKINSEIVIEGARELTFTLPKIMNMLMVDIKVQLNTFDVEAETFLVDYKNFIEHTAKSEFPKTISIKVKQTYRYLASYIKNLDGDVLTALFATAVIARKDNAKAAYTSTRTEATRHSQLVMQWWNILDLDGVASVLLGIPSHIFQTTVSVIAEQKFTGSGKVVDVNKAKNFFRIIHCNIYKYRSDSADYFNLVSIYVRYAMTFLLGTRNFLNSANFNSYSRELELWSIIEKSQDDASGIRVVPVCNVMQNLFVIYVKLLLQRGLKERNIFLLIDSKYISYNGEKAGMLISNMDKFSQDDRDTLKQFVDFAPLNSGRHLLTQKAIDDSVSSNYIDAYLGHYAAGEEPLGKFSTFDVADYINAINSTTTKIANEYGIKEL